MVDFRAVVKWLHFLTCFLLLFISFCLKSDPNKNSFKSEFYGPSRSHENEILAF